MIVKNKSLMQKAAARLLAVQAIYQYQFLEKKPSSDELIDDMLTMFDSEQEIEDKSEQEFLLPASPNKKLFRTIINGYFSSIDEINAKILEILGEARFGGNRLSDLLKAILRAAAFEIIYTPELKKNIILDEYTTVTASFFDDPELTLMNGLLQEIADEVRGDKRENPVKVVRKKGKLAIAPKVEYKKAVETLSPQEQKSAERIMNEFDVIKNLFLPLTNGEESCFGLTDDAAMLSPPSGTKLVVTKDVINEGIHFIGSESPENIAKKLIAVNLSDIAAMGAKPYAYMLGGGLPAGKNHSEWLEGFCDGLRQMQDEYGVFLLGGDTTNTKNNISLSATMFGVLPINQEPLRRNAAKSGDNIYVSGFIGDSALGLKLIKSEFDDLKLSDKTKQYLKNNYELPTPQISLGQVLSELGFAGACMDISDGLLQDLSHICDCSKTGATLEIDKIPTSTAAQEVAKKLENKESFNKIILSGGDDYELLFTMPKNKSAMAEQHLTKFNISKIGEITDDISNISLEYGNKLKNITATGWSHSF